MTDFNRAVAGCISKWGRQVADSDGSNESLETASRELRKCLDMAFPDSEAVNLQGDKVNYMLSSVFFLANRLAKASQGLAEFDKTVGSFEDLANEPNQEKSRVFSKTLDDILSKYF
jgi:hypothetical protein